MKKYSYFPGCSAESTGISYTMSTNYVANKIGLELEEIPEWSCCGASAARLMSYDLGFALPARSMALAEEMNPAQDVVTPCAGCYSSLKGAVHYSRASEANLKHIQDMIQRPYEAKVDVVSLLEAFADDEVKEALAPTFNTPMSAFKVASYYGCALVRPEGMTRFDDPEDPQSMDDLVEMTGATVVDWAFKTECCGAAQQMAVPQPSRVLVERIFQNAEANGANCIVTACPLCWMNLDMRVRDTNKQRIAEGKKPFDIPVFYFTEFLGLAEGGNTADLGIDKHFQSTTGFVDEKIRESAQLDEQARIESEEAARKEAERAARIAARKAEKRAADLEKEEVAK